MWLACSKNTIHISLGESCGGDTESLLWCVKEAIDLDGVLVGVGQRKRSTEIALGMHVHRHKGKRADEFPQLEITVADFAWREEIAEEARGW